MRRFDTEEFKRRLQQMKQRGPLPVLMEADPVLKPVLKQLHITLVYTMLVIIAVHLLAALKHHFIDRDGVLKRMLP